MQNTDMKAALEVRGPSERFEEEGSESVKSGRCSFLCKLLVGIALVLMFFFVLYASCADTLGTLRVSETTMPILFHRLLRECFELPMTIVSILTLSFLLEALAGQTLVGSLHVGKQFRKIVKTVGRGRLQRWFVVLVLAGFMVLIGLVCERYGIVDETYSIFRGVNDSNLECKALTVAWCWRIVGVLNGVLFLCLFIRLNRCLTVLLQTLYCIIDLLLMLGSPPVFCAGH